jgi:hypothetical protein
MMSERLFPTPANVIQRLGRGCAAWEEQMVTNSGPDTSPHRKSPALHLGETSLPAGIGAGCETHSSCLINERLLHSRSRNYEFRWRYPQLGISHYRPVA